MATFSFSTLPWICQKRFAEICDTETMKEFKQCNSQTEELSKNRKICKWIQIGYKKHPECHRDYCTCLPGVVYENVKISKIQNIEITEEMKIDLARTKITKEFIQTFSFFARQLKVISAEIEFDALKILLERNLKSFVFVGRIAFTNIEKDLEYLINRMIEIDDVVFTMRFDVESEELILENAKKLCGKYEEFFDFWSCKHFHLAISKNFY